MNQPRNEPFVPRRGSAAAPSGASDVGAADAGEPDHGLGDALADPAADPAAVAAQAASFTPDDWRAAFALLDRLLELEPTARAEQLAAPGAVPAPLAPLLHRLLRERLDLTESGFLEAPALAPPPADTAAAATADARARRRHAQPEAPAEVGPYRLLREIGRGGMASVWLAERTDGLLDRRVALKLPHGSWGAGLLAGSLAARMARERNILASLTHPNIARLYDAGVAADGRPFLALEHVEGEPIDAFAEARRLGTRERVALVVQVARAVAHAHRQLVVHRDLKPSNILVDAEAQVHLLDFGIARLLVDAPLGGDAADASFTQAHGRVLTPDYASPEQIRGDAVDTGSDVYSLGVVLFELLAGTRPYRLPHGVGPAALADAIGRIEVPRPSAVAAEPQVQRQLRGDLDAIVARALRPASADRYPGIDALADDLERHLRGEPVAARPDSRWYRSERWMRRHKLESAIAAAVVVAVPAGAAAQAAVLGAIGMGAAVALWQMREARRQAMRAQKQADRAEQVKDFALSMLRGASVDSGAGAATTAADLLQAAHARIERELAGRPEVTVELLTAVGYGLFGLGQLAEAEAASGRALALARRELAPAHPHTLAAMVVSAFVQLDLDRPREAVALLLPAVAEATRLRATHTLVDALCCLTSARIKEGDVEAGLACAQAAVDALSAPGATPQPLDAVNAWVALASALDIAKRPGVADAARRALTHAQAVYGDRVVEATLNARILLAKGMATDGQDAVALAEFDIVLADTMAFFGATHPNVAWLAYNRGSVRLDTGDTAGAIEDFRLQLALYEGRGGDAGSNLGLGHSVLGKAFAAARRDAEAIEHYETAARLLHAAAGPQSWFVLRAVSARALVLLRLGRRDDAERAFEAIADAAWTGSELERAAHLGRLALLRSVQGRHDEAVALAREGESGLRSHASAIYRAGASSALGRVLLAAGRAEDAVPVLEQAVRLYADKQLAVSPDQAEARSALARARAATPANVGDGAPDGMK